MQLDAERLVTMAPYVTIIPRSQTPLHRTQMDQNLDLVLFRLSKSHKENMRTILYRMKPEH